MSQPDPDPLVKRPASPMYEITLAIGGYRNEYLRRYGKRPDDVLVLAGRRVWQQLLEVVADQGEEWWRVDESTGTVIGRRGTTRIVQADIPENTWLLVTPTEWTGSVE